MKAKRDDIAAIIKMHDILKAYGLHDDRNRIKCPIHNGTGKNFSWRDSRWKCFSCGKQGDIFNFVEYYENCDFKTALDRICNMFNIPNDNDMTKEQKKEYEEMLSDRRRKSQEAAERIEYEWYTIRRICAYRAFLYSMQRSAQAELHISWCNRLLDLIIYEKFDYESFDVDARIRGMYQQLQVDH